MELQRSSRTRQKELFGASLSEWTEIRYWSALSTAVSKYARGYCGYNGTAVRVGRALFLHQALKGVERSLANDSAPERIAPGLNERLQNIFNSCSYLVYDRTDCLMLESYHS